TTARGRPKSVEPGRHGDAAPSTARPRAGRYRPGGTTPARSTPLDGPPENRGPDAYACNTVRFSHEIGSSWCRISTRSVAETVLVSGCGSPARTCINVVLPAPLDPVTSTRTTGAMDEAGTSRRSSMLTPSRVDREVEACSSRVFETNSAVKRSGRRTCGIGRPWTKLKVFRRRNTDQGFPDADAVRDAHQSCVRLRSIHR